MSCDNCGSDVEQVESGYVCNECQTLIVDGTVTGWAVYSRRLFEE